MDQHEDYSFCRGQMAPDEYVLWTGKPEKGNLFSGQDLISLPFAVVFTGFAVFWIITAMQAPGPFFLFGIPFLGVGLYLLFGRFLRTAYLRKRTAYVITNKRIYRKMGNKTDNLPGVGMPAYETIMHRNGNGTIRFPLAPDPYVTYRTNRRTVVRYFALENLADVERAQQAIARMSINES